MINGVLSDRFDLSFGVPQGSCLGPLLFSAYASKLFQVIKHACVSFICRSSQTVQWVRRKQGVLWKDVLGP